MESRTYLTTSLENKLTLSVNPDQIILQPQNGQSIGIEAIRKLKLWAEKKPFYSQTRCKIALIRSAERLTVEAQNALLKLLEEPPLQTYIILAVVHQNLLPTVISRCQKISPAHLRKLIPEIYPSDLQSSPQRSLPPSFSSLALSERFKLAEEISQHKKREEVINLLERWMRELRDNFHRMLQEDLTNLTTDHPMSFPKKIEVGKNISTLRKIQKTHQAITQNANIRLSLENLLIEW